MAALQLVLLTCLVLAASGQGTVSICPNGSVVFLLDMSENAETASTVNKSDRYHLMREALVYFLELPAVSNPASNLRFLIYGYSGSASQTITPAWSNSSATIALLDSLGKNINASGSWTYTGLSQVQGSPPSTNNMVVVISSQGSGSTSRTARADTEATRLRNLGWHIQVLAVQGLNQIDFNELTIVNNGTPPTNVTDPDPGAVYPMGYKSLKPALISLLPQLGCFTFTLTTPSTPAPTTELVLSPEESCNMCKTKGGSRLVRAPEGCDCFYTCSDIGGAPVKQNCPAGTFFSKGNCLDMNSVTCPLIGVCAKNSAAVVLRESCTCCNKFFRCQDGVVTYERCPVGQVFNATTKTCQVPVDKQAACGGVGTYECDVGPPEPIGASNCPCSYNPLGNPCLFSCGGQEMPLNVGTRFDPDICAINYATATSGCLAQPGYPVTDRDLSPDCSAVFRASYNGGSEMVFNDRLQTNLSVATLRQEAYLADNAVVFTPGMAQPFLYYYYFNQMDFAENWALRLRFWLQDPVPGRKYDLLSNNFCPLCPETILFTAVATSDSVRTVSAMFITGKETVFISAEVVVTDRTNWLEMIIVFGESSVTGVVREINTSLTAVVKTTKLSVAAKTPGATINPNDCGLALGFGPNIHFQGKIDEFALYRFCQDIYSLIL